MEALRYYVRRDGAIVRRKLTRGGKGSMTNQTQMVADIHRDSLEGQSTDASTFSKARDGCPDPVERDVHLE